MSHVTVPLEGTMQLSLTVGDPPVSDKFPEVLNRYVPGSRLNA